MNRSDLGKRLGERLSISPKAATQLVDAVFDEIASATCQGETVRVHRFGRFIPRVRSAGDRRNPLTGAPMDFSDRVSVVFLPGGYYKARLNQDAS